MGREEMTNQKPSKTTSMELNVFFDEKGQFRQGYDHSSMHLKITALGGLEEKELMMAELVGTALKAVDVVRRIAEAEDLDKIPPESPEPPPETRHAPQDKEGAARERRAPQPNGCTAPQANKILAICHRLEDTIVQPELQKYAGAEWRLDAGGHCLPTWDFLMGLTKRQASNIIEHLERAES